MDKMDTSLHPGIGLLIGLLVLALPVWVFWPPKGLRAYFGRIRLNHQRVLLEDALKFRFDCEYKHKTCSLISVIGKA